MPNLRRHVSLFALFVGLCSAAPSAKAAVPAAQGAAAQSQTAGQTPAAIPSQATSDPGQQRRRQYAGMGRVMGEVTAVNGSTLTIKAEDGSLAQVVTTDNTRIMKDRGPVRMSDLHPGDGLMAMGNMDAGAKTLHAAVVIAEDAAQVKAMRENLGKTYITGRVTAVDLDNAKMTVERPDHQAQVIGFDESTSFKRAVRGGAANGGPGANGGAGGPAGPGGAGGAGGDGSGGEGRGPGGGGFNAGGAMGMGGMATGGIDRAFSNGESITLADIKVGDYVAGTGLVKSGTFVPVHMVDTPPGQRRQRTGEGNGVPSATAPVGQPAAPGPGAR